MSSTTLPSLLDAKHHLPKLRYADRANVFGEKLSEWKHCMEGSTSGWSSKISIWGFRINFTRLSFLFSPKSCSLEYGLKDFPGTMSELSMTVVKEDFSNKQDEGRGWPRAVHV